MGIIIAFANQKGGVGKTTSAVNISACLGNEGYKTLLIDLDPQGNATQGLGIDKYTVENTTYSVLLLGFPIESAIKLTEYKNLYILPSNRDLAGGEVELVDIENRESKLREKISAIIENFDFIIIDCPPALGLLTINGLVTAHKVIVPLQCEYYALEGLGELLQTVKRIRDNFNPSLTILGILLTMYQHTNLSKQVAMDVQQHLENLVFNTIVPRNVTLSEAPSYGKPVIYYDGKSIGAQAYIALTKEILSREFQ
ncbi:MAG TPA: AAA family ATPase [Candidatus Hydrogenedens sp.]|nr:AAA family ATPase [Candidatus Hydrogenedens sp.]HOL20070.1 AAA family ATPase [Candidatus Hydrogenedens sp.]HPP59661.1 AAA family ATPase [Candidatus Hydrogenedens sp.]